MACAETAATPAALAPAPVVPATNFGELVDRVSETIARHFHDEALLRRIDWSARVAEARGDIVAAPTLAVAAQRINALLGELKTSHTALYTPDEPDYYILLDVVGGEGAKDLIEKRFWGSGPVFAGIGAFTTELGGRHFVDGVLEGSPADRAGIAYGHEIVSVDGEPYHPIASFRGKAGREAAIRFRRHRETVLETVRVPVVMIQPKKAFADATQASARILQRDGRRIGYVHLWSSTDVEVLRSALQRLGESPGGSPGRGRNRGGGAAQLADRVDWLVIDMRGRVGGYASVPSAFLDLIDPPERRIGIRVTTTRDGHGGSEAARTLRGRTAMLIDRKTRSAGEIFAHGFKRAKLGPLVGATTAGAVIAGRAFVMPGETLLYVAIRGLEIDGIALEGKGVEPDVRVERPLPYANGADPVLDAALALVAGK